MPVLPGDRATRRTPPGAGPGCCRSWPTARWSGGFRRRGAARVAGPVPVLQGLLVGLPGRGGHGDLQGRGAAPALPAPAAPGRRTTRWAGCRGWRGWRRGRPRLANALLRTRPAGRRWPSGSAASTPRRAAAALRRRRASGAGSPARRPRDRPARCCSGWTPSPTTSPPRSGRPRCACSSGPGYGVRIAERPVCCGLTWISTGQLDGARRQLRPTLDALGPALADGHAGRRPRAVVHRGAARRRHRAAARRPARRCRSRPPRARWPSCSPARRGGARRRWPASRRSPSRTATSMRSWAGTPDRELLAAAGARRGRGRRLLRAGRQLRRRAGPLRGVRRGGRDGAAARRAAARRRARCVLADGFSCRTQLDQLAGARAVHLAQLLDTAARRPAARRPAARRPAARRPPARRRGPDRTGRRPERSSVSAPFTPPPYPYERLGEIVAIAGAHEGGAVDLSIGTPCDPPPAAVLDALGVGDTARGYPPLDRHRRLPRRRRGVDRAAPRAPRRPGRRGRRRASAPRSSSRPSPQYLQPARPVARHRAVPGDQLPDLRDGRDAGRAARGRPTCGWTRSPTADAARGAVRVGQLAGQPHRRRCTTCAAAARWGRARGVPVLSDECYAEFTWSGAPTTILRDRAPPGCSRCTRCPSGTTSPAPASAATPATPSWCTTCARSASTPG